MRSVYFIPKAVALLIKSIEWQSFFERLSGDG